MLLRTFLMGALLMTTVTASAEFPPRPEWNAAQREAWAVVTAWNDAFEANDAEAYFSYVAPEIVVLTPGSPYRVQFKDPDRRELEFGVKEGYAKVRFFQELDPIVDVYGDVAVITYYSRGFWSSTATQMAYLKETNVLVKRNGKWEIVHIHVSK